MIREVNKSEQKQKEACHELLVALRQDLLLKHPFIGAIALRLELVPVYDSRLDIAATDGTRIFVHAGNFKKFSKAEALFVVAHEVWHTVLLHFLRIGDREPFRFNCATDLEIHFVLEKENFVEPFVLPHNKAWAGKSAEVIYDLLECKMKSLPGGKKSKNLEQPNNGKDPTGFDTHIYPEDADDNKGAGNSSAAQAGGDSGDIILDPDFAPAVEDGVADRVRGAVNAAAHQVYRDRGGMPAHIKSLLDAYLQTEISWKEILARFVTECYSGSRRWLPPSRRHVWRGLYLPSFRTESMRAVVALDTSGSMVKDIKKFLSEFMGLLRAFGRYEITMIQCDDAIRKVETFTSDNPLTPDYKWKVSGFGYTDFRPPFDYVDKHPELEPSIFIYCTDGCGRAPETAPDYPVMWVLTSDGMGPANWGMKLKLKKKEKPFVEWE